MARRVSVDEECCGVRCRCGARYSGAKQRPFTRATSVTWNPDDASATSAHIVQQSHSTRKEGESRQGKRVEGRAASAHEGHVKGGAFGGA